MSLRDKSCTLPDIAPTASLPPTVVVDADRTSSFTYHLSSLATLLSCPLLPLTSLSHASFTSSADYDSLYLSTHLTDLHPYTSHPSPLNKFQW